MKVVQEQRLVSVPKMKILIDSGDLFPHIRSTMLIEDLDERIDLLEDPNQYLKRKMNVHWPKQRIC